MAEFFEVIDFTGNSDVEGLRKLIDYLEGDPDRVLIGCWNAPSDTDVVSIQATIASDDGKQPAEIRTNLEFFPAQWAGAAKAVTADRSLDGRVGTYEVESAPVEDDTENSGNSENEQIGNEDFNGHQRDASESE